MKIGIVAGETSGDHLGAGLVKELRKRSSDIDFTGICGPRMQALGLSSMFEMDSISIMGVDGLLASIRKILKVRKTLEQTLSREKPDVFVGIDVPDFNLTLEEKLRRRGIRTIHYVSPTVWAWRGYRIRKIRRAVDHMLTLFPFEAEFYQQRGIPATFVGHPIADEIDPDIDQAAVRRNLDLPLDRPIIALLPGSRTSEIRRLGELFLRTANQLGTLYPDAIFITPAANKHTEQQFAAMVKQHATVPTRIYQHRSQQVMAAADVILLASGTAALEAALLQRPMVVAYKVSLLTSLMVRLFAHVKYFSMPNNLLERPIVPEFLQKRATEANLVPALAAYLDDAELRQSTSEQFAGILQTLRRGANQRAAELVLSIAGA